MNTKPSANNHVTPLIGWPDPFSPLYEKNISRVLPTLLSFLGYPIHEKKTLIDYKKIFKENNCYKARFTVNIILDGFGVTALEQSFFWRSFSSKRLEPFCQAWFLV
ncbi:MAG: hypothetical protein ACTSW4_00285 [Candidatus Ranarchaeia archaeon]